MPEELEGLEPILSDTYFCNFSVFQSLPDSWAIDQLFPIMPIHRLNERPTRNAVLADITCDSDGKIDRFVSQRDVKRTLELHELRPGEEYYLAAFLVGAYQETLGDLHNLFGDTHVVHIRLHDEGGWWIEEIVKGDTAGKVLSYMQYDVDRLFPQFARDCERAVREGRMTLAESQALRRFYEWELNGYTYLEPDGRSRAGADLQRPMDLKALFAVFATIFLAELGDKTQLATVLFAASAKHNPWFLFLTVSVAWSARPDRVLAGGWVSRHMDTRMLSIVAGVGFIAIGAWTS